MGSEIIYFASYDCPGCRTQLETRFAGWDGWLRCPVCKWPSLPPEVMVDRRETRRRAALLQSADDDILVISELPEAAFEPNSRLSADVGRSSHSSPARLILMIGFAFSLFLVLAAYLDDRWGNMAIFAILAIVFFFLLVRPPGKRASS